MAGLKEKIKELEKLQEKIDLVGHVRQGVEKLVAEFNKESKLLEKSDREEVKAAFCKFSDSYVKLLEGSATPVPVAPPAPEISPQSANPAAPPAKKGHNVAPTVDTPVPPSYRKFVGVEAKANVNGNIIEGKVKNVTGNAIVFASYGGEILLLKPEQFIPPTGR